MSSFVIQPHGRLHEFVADRLGFFADEGLDYSIEGNETFGVDPKPSALTGTDPVALS
jgi:hypothetical protein